MPYYFYLARCRDGSLYAGTCMDPATRQAKHNDGTGAKYTRSRRPVKIIYHEACATLGEARRREAEIKRWRKRDKEELAASTRRAAEYQRLLPSSCLEKTSARRQARERSLGARHLEPLQNDTHHQNITMVRNLSKIASCEEASQNFARRIGIR
ncbi:GIY-YIG nuclease family protein [Candidatus Peregrinibacteria bacterium]|nr:GIY-YIG nuclease family protein [Candidatus Peregrinibacteria bacterium]